MRHVERPIVLACDIDCTLTAGDYEPKDRLLADRALNELIDALHGRKQHEPLLYTGTITGRTHVSHSELERQNPAFARFVDLADFKATAVGSDIAIKNKKGLLVADTQWPPVEGWDRGVAREVVELAADVRIQPDDAQTAHKLSFDVAKNVSEKDHARFVEYLLRQLGQAGIQAEIILSGGTYLDVLPKGVHKGSALGHVATKLAGKSALKVIAGDSENDASLVEAVARDGLAILPENASASLQRLAQKNMPKERLYIARTKFAAGVLEGLRHFEFIES
jgi:sucrose-6F-phosphate phosphohydrolase